MFSKRQINPRSLVSSLAQLILLPQFFVRSLISYMRDPFSAVDQELEVFKKLLISSQELLHSRIRAKDLAQWGPDDNLYYDLQIHTYVNSVSGYADIFNQVVFDTRRMQISLIFISFVLPLAFLLFANHMAPLSFMQNGFGLLLVVLGAPKIAMDLISHIIKKYFLVRAVDYANKASQLIAKQTFYSVNAIRTKHALNALTVQVDQCVITEQGHPFDLSELIVAMPIVLSGKNVPSAVVLDSSNKRRTRAGSELR